MHNLIRIIKEHKLLGKKQLELNQLKYQDDLYYVSGDAKLYKNSLYVQDRILFFIAKLNKKKSLYIVSLDPFKSEFKGNIQNIDGHYVQEVEFNHKHSLKLQKLFPFTAPISLRDKKTTFGCGDRLGLATPGHIRAAMKFDLYPVLAQQSIRELDLTQRNYAQVTSDVTFLVFQEGFERGYGADGDHLKTMEDINRALKAGMPMITLDLSNYLNTDAMFWDKDKIEKKFEYIDAEERNRILRSYADRSFNIGDYDIIISSIETKRCTLVYRNALNFAQKVDKYLKKYRKNNYDLEISIDETTTSTIPSHHIFIINEIIHRNIIINSLAPKFIGDFQKAIDYIGDIEEFEKDFKIHCKIAKNYGNYKISIHSGSDKFSVYPIIGKYTASRFHLKTAGTSWLEALKCIAKCNPTLYRKIHKKAFQYFQVALKYYHITADISKIQNIDELKDDDLINFFEKDESRQLLHITYGGILNDPEIKEEFFDSLSEFEEVHYELVKNHISKHMELLGIKKLE
jgi:hypothetical protein